MLGGLHRFGLWYTGFSAYPGLKPAVQEGGSWMHGIVFFFSVGTGIGPVLAAPFLSESESSSSGPAEFDPGVQLIDNRPFSYS